MLSLTSSLLFRLDHSSIAVVGRLSIAAGDGEKSLLAGKKPALPAIMTR